MRLRYVVSNKSALGSAAPPSTAGPGCPYAPDRYPNCAGSPTERRYTFFRARNRLPWNASWDRCSHRYVAPPPLCRVGSRLALQREALGPPRCSISCLQMDCLSFTIVRDNDFAYHAPSNLLFSRPLREQRRRASGEDYFNRLYKRRQRPSMSPRITRRWPRLASRTQVPRGPGNVTTPALPPRRRLHRSRIFSIRIPHRVRRPVALCRP